MRLAILMVCGLVFATTTEALHAQEPRAPNSGAVADATVGNSVLQLRYLSAAPFSGVRGDLDYGLLLSENRDVIGSAALMFDTALNTIPRLSFEIGPQAYVALLAAQQKTDVFATALGANARYELIRRLGIAVSGSGFFSPGVLTFGSAHNLYDFTAGAEVRFAPRMVGLAGYRWLKFTLVNEPDVRVQNELFAGLRWQLE